MRRGRRLRLSKRKLGTNYFYCHFWFYEPDYIKVFVNGLHKVNLRKYKKHLRIADRKHRKDISNETKDIKKVLHKLEGLAREASISNYCWQKLCEYKPKSSLKPKNKKNDSLGRV